MVFDLFDNAPAGDPQRAVQRQSAEAEADDDERNAVTGDVTRDLLKAAVYRNATVVGTQTSSHGVHEAVAIPLRDRFTHVFCSGDTGEGKTQLMTHTVLQDAAAGHSVVVINPKGDFIDEILARLPGDRMDDVVYVNPAAEVTPAINVLEPHGVDGMTASQRDAQVGVLTGALLDVFRSQSNNWGDRFGRIFQALFSTCIRANIQRKMGERDGELATLQDVYDAVVDEEARRELIDREDRQTVRDGLVELHEHMTVQERQPLVRRLRDFLGEQVMQEAVGTPRSTVNLRSVLDEGKILLVDVRRGELGPGVTAMLGALILSQVWSAAQARVTVPKRERHPAMLYVDELDVFTGASSDIADLLARAREYRLGTWLAVQYPEQLPRHVRDAVFRNARTKVVFPTREDAQGQPGGALRGVSKQVVREAQNTKYCAVVDRIDRAAVAADTLPPWEARDDVLERRKRYLQERYGDDAEAPAGVVADEDGQQDDAAGPVQDVRVDQDLGHPAVAGNADHQELLHYAQQVFEQRGWTVDLVYQEGGRTRPDGILERDGVTCHLEAECGTSRKPARILQNLWRAYEEDRPCVFVVPEDAAERVANVLRDPVNRQGSDHVDAYGTYSYYQSDEGEVTDVDQLRQIPYVVYAVRLEGLYRTASRR